MPLLREQVAQADAQRRAAAQLGAGEVESALRVDAGGDQLVVGVGPRVSRTREATRAAMLITRASGPDLALLTALIDRGELRPLIHRVYPLDEIQAAHREFESGRFAGKIVVRVGEGAPDV